MWERAFLTALCVAACESKEGNEAAAYTGVILFCACVFAFLVFLHVDAYCHRELPAPVVHSPLEPLERSDDTVDGS